MNSDRIVEMKECISFIKANYVGMDTDTLSTLFNITSQCKQRNSLLVKPMFLMANPLILSKENEFIIKTVQIDKYNSLAQAISFPAFDFKSLIKEEWEESTLRKMLVNNCFIFVVFRNNDVETFLEKVFLWKMPTDIIDNSVIKVWTQTKEILESGSIVKYIENDRYFTNFPGSKDNPYMHVRPHSQNKNDVKELPIPDKLTGLDSYPKQCFWFNRFYINKVINENE